MATKCLAVIAENWIICMYDCWAKQQSDVAADKAHPTDGAG